jgi:hypothetical protein
MQPSNPIAGPHNKCLIVSHGAHFSICYISHPQQGIMRFKFKLVCHGTAGGCLGVFVCGSVAELTGV